MTKRMIDTELWNNSDIIENFTAEDRYFWLYLLTNPHNSICGVMKYSPALIARDMGYHKDCVQNLVYRFETVHKAIVVDKNTNELVIVNWGKFNWNKSKDILATVSSNAKKIFSDTIRAIVMDKVNAYSWSSEGNRGGTGCPQGGNRVSTGGGQDTITNTSTNTNKPMVGNRRNNNIYTRARAKDSSLWITCNLSLVEELVKDNPEREELFDKMLEVILGADVEWKKKAIEKMTNEIFCKLFSRLWTRRQGLGGEEIKDEEAYIWGTLGKVKG